MEPLQPPEGGTSAPDRERVQARVRDITAHVFSEYVRRVKLSPRKVGERLAELGWHGRGHEPYAEETVRGWLNGSFAPPATVLVAVVLDAEMSIDQLVYGAGLRAEVDELRAATDAGNRELGRLQKDVELLAGVVTRHLQLDPAAAEAMEGVGRRGVEPA